MYTEEHKIFGGTCFRPDGCGQTLFQQCLSPGCLAQLASRSEVAWRNLCAFLLCDHLLSSSANYPPICVELSLNKGQTENIAKPSRLPSACHRVQNHCLGKSLGHNITIRCCQMLAENFIFIYSQNFIYII